MKHLGRIRTLVVTGAVALAGLTWAAVPAHASEGSIGASGGPGVVGVSGYGFAPGTSVDLNVLGNPSLESLDPEVTVQANQYGEISWDFYNLSAGPVWVAADPQSPTGGLSTLWAQATVSAPPAFGVNGTGQMRCRAPVTADVVGLEPGTSVRFELLPQSLSNVLSSSDVTADGYGDAYASPALLTGGYVGWAWIAADQSPNFGTGQPAPATVWHELYVC